MTARSRIRPDETRPGETRLRADARRNRDQIIASAASAFADDGPHVPMEEIARLAGVGVGTLYRHFPDREALIMAVVQASMRTMLDRAREAETDEPRAWDALVRALSTSRELSLTLRVPGLFSPTIAAVVHDDPTIRQIRRELVRVIDGLVRAAQQEGSLRPDVGTGDVVHLFSLLLRGLDKMPGEAAELAFQRARAVILDGLRARPDTPLPGHPLTAADLDPGCADPGCADPGSADPGSARRRGDGPGGR